MDRKTLRELERVAIEKARSQTVANRLRDKEMNRDAIATRAKQASHEQQARRVGEAYAAARKTRENVANLEYARLLALNGIR